MSLPKIDVPLFDVLIPSLNKKTKIKQMKVKEEKILLIAKESGEDGDILDAIKQIVNNCIVDEKININKLTIFDIEYLFLKLRALSINNMATVSYIDMEDKKEYAFNINLDDVVISKPTKDKIIMVDDKIGIEMKYPLATIFTVKFYKNKKDNELIDDMVYSCVNKIFSEDTVTTIENISKEELMDFIDNLDISTYNKIKEFITDIPRLNYKLEYKNSLGNVHTIILSTLQDFFLLG